MAPTQRDHMFHVRMSDDERRMLEALAEHEGLTASDKIRQLVRRDFIVTFGEAPKTKPKRNK